MTTLIRPSPKNDLEIMKLVIRIINLIQVKTIQINNYETFELTIGDSLGYKVLELRINIYILKENAEEGIPS